MLPKILCSFFIVIIITIKDSNQETVNQQMEYPLFPAFPNNPNYVNRLQKRESDPDVMADPEGRAGLEDLTKPLSQSPIGQSPLGQLAAGMAPKQIIMGMFQAMVIEPKPGDISNLAGGLSNFQGLLPGGGSSSK